jgi:hypothetical protein
MHDSHGGDLKIEFDLEPLVDKIEPVIKLFLIALLVQESLLCAKR